MRKRRHGFRARKATVGGRKILAARRARGRTRLSATKQGWESSGGARIFSPPTGAFATHTRFHLLVRKRPDDDPAMRLGITGTKKVGGAVGAQPHQAPLRVLAAQVLPETGIAGRRPLFDRACRCVDRPFDQFRPICATPLGRVKR